MTADDALERAYAELAARPLADVAALAAWLVAWSELESVVDEEGVRRAVMSACAVDDATAYARHAEFVERVAPRCEVLRRGLARRLRMHPGARAPEVRRHGGLLRWLDALEGEQPEQGREEQRLVAEGQRLRASAIEWDGAPRSLAVVEAALDDPSRTRREAAWRAVDDLLNVRRPALDAVFDRLVAVRQAQAEAAGFTDVQSHRFRALGREDYGPEDCRAWCAAIAEEVAPLASELLEQRRVRLGVATLRPWDLTAPLAGEDATRPFAGERALIDGCVRAIGAVDLGLGELFAELGRRGLLDLMARPNKAPGAFQVQLQASGLPFVCAGAVGRTEDLWAVLHEAGHAVHALACADEPLIWDRRPQLEVAELASTTMELLAGAHLDAFFDSECASRAARREQVVQAVLFLTHVACVDEFNDWLSRSPRSAGDAAARDRAWLAIHSRWAPGVDWDGLERARQWQRESHLFAAPFRLFAYGVAQVGALELLERWMAAPRETVAAYRRALAIGGRVGVRALYAAAGIELRFDRDHVAARVRFVRRLLAQLE